MRAGRLRHRVQVQRPVETRSSTGAITQDWITVVSTWAEVSPLTNRQRERLAGDQIIADMDATIRMRWIPALDGMNATWRVRHKSKFYNLLGVANVDERNKELEAIGSVGANDG